MLQILIIDDDKNIRRYLKTILLAAGYTPICTETADEALHIMETYNIALIILDIMLPGTDGFTFTKLLRDCKNDIPILMHTAKQLPDDIKTGFLAGADDYMTKPADEDVLLLRIKALLRRAKITAEHQLRIGHTILNYTYKCRQIKTKFSGKNEPSYNRFNLCPTVIIHISRKRSYDPAHPSWLHQCRATVLTDSASDSDRDHQYCHWHLDHTFDQPPAAQTSSYIGRGYSSSIHRKL